MNIKMPTVGISGEYGLIVSEDAEMKRVKEQCEFHNLLTDTFMNRLGEWTSGDASSILPFWGVVGRFVLGSGNAPPQFTDTALQSPIVISPNPAYVADVANYANGYVEITASHQFGQGIAAGNLSEIGMQRDSLTGPLASRSLILDGVGAPTTLTVLESDFLTCFYRLRYNIPQVDTVHQIVVMYDDVPVETEVTIRPLRANSNQISNGWGFNPMYHGLTNTAFAFNGGLAAPTASTPLGSPVSANFTESSSFPTYEEDSFERFFKTTLSLNQVNSNEIRTVVVRRMLGCWQVEFDPPLQKNNTQTMDLTFGYSWARA